MKLIKPSYEIITDLESREVKKILKILEKVARTCYKSEDKITEDSADKMIEMLIKKGHEAMIEFADIIVKFTCDRGVSHEIVRHRLGSFAQESTRYCNYSKDKFDNQITYIIPSWMSNYLPTNNAYCGNDNPWWDTFKDLKDPNLLWLNSMQVAENNYFELLKLGWSPQEARSVLPNSLKTEINVKFNLREWRHFFKMRCSLAAHPQMRELTIPLLEEFKSKIPILFDDLNY
jgi:thymidylate synthase (FAD)